MQEDGRLNMIKKESERGEIFTVSTDVCECSMSIFYPLLNPHAEAISQALCIPGRRLSPVSHHLVLPARCP